MATLNNVIANSTGCVGVGTSSPSRLLEIKGTNSPPLRLNTTSGNCAMEFLTSASTYSWLVGGQYTVNNAFEITPSTSVGGTTFSSPSILIKSDGNIGIGTTSPVAKLHIDDASTPYIRITRSGTPTWELRNNYPSTEYGFSINNVTAGTTVLFAGQSGNVGIGTTSPAYKLDVAGSINTSTFMFVSYQYGNAFPLQLNASNFLKANDYYYGMTINSGDVNYISGKFLINGGTYKRVELYGYENGIGYIPTVIPGGSVGIGTTNPTAALDVSRLEYPSLGGILASFTAGTTTPTTEKYVYLKQTYTGAAYDSPMLAFRANANSVNSGSFGTVRTTSNGSIAFSNVNATSGTVTAVSEKMRIDANGNVGIGTTVIRSKLEIAGNTSSPPIASVQWTPTARSGSFGIDGTGVYIRNSSNGDYFDLKNASGVARFRVIYDNATHLTTNFVSIGNLSQTGSKLSVFGNTSIGSSYGSTAAPSNGLIVQGSVGIGTNSVDSWAQLKVIGTSALGGIVYVTDKIQALTAFPGSATNLQINPDGGNVGIGTTSPTANLTVYNSSTPTIDFNTGTSTSRGRISATSSDFTIAALTSSPLIFKIDSSEKIRITSDGNVGIGTTSVSTKLAVEGGSIATVNSTGTDVRYSFDIRTLVGGAIGFNNAAATNVYGAVTGSAYYGVAQSYPIVFTTNGVERLRIAAGGNVGIGTTSPISKLHVSYGNDSQSVKMIGAGGSTNGNFIYSLATDYSDTFGLNVFATAHSNTARTNTLVRIHSNETSNGSLPLRVTTQGTIASPTYEALSVNYLGNIGIGTTSPVYKLEVNGSLYATRLSGSAMFTTSGKGRFYGTASYALAAPAGSSLTGQTDSVTPFETSLGHQAGNSNTGTGNTAIGYQALFSNTTGTGSIAIGYQALYSNTRGKRNIAIGYEALRTTQGSTDGFGDPIGDENVAIGYQAARAAFNINRVVAIGHRALAKNLAGGNVAIGWLAMESNVGTANSNLGILNTAVGTMALSSNTSGNANSAFGYLALNANTTGNENTAVGHRSMLYNTTGKNNCSFGSYALYYNQIANNNSAFGAFALYSNTTNNNSAFGYKALRYNTTGVNNDAFGYQALYSNISGKGNSAFGFQALKYTTTATGNSAFGRSALTQCSGGGRNSAFGYYSSGAITGNPAFGGSGMDNCSFGYRSLRFNNSGNNNTAVGKDALYNNKVSNQTAIGYNALLGSTTGNGGNTAVGSNAGSAITFGYRNTMIGNNAGATGAAPLTTGQNNTCLGNGAITSTATVSNEITLGNSSITTLRCQVTTITSLSDIRDKDDIIPVDVGLSFIEKLRPVTFKWDKREWYTDGNRDGSKKDTITQIGFIAQELKALQESENATYLNLVYESNPDKLEATPGNLMIPLIKAVQELNAIVKQQRVEFDDKIAKQQLEIDYLKSKLNN